MLPSSPQHTRPRRRTLWLGIAASLVAGTAAVVHGVPAERASHACVVALRGALLHLLQPDDVLRATAQPSPSAARWLARLWRRTVEDVARIAALLLVVKRVPRLRTWLDVA